MIDLLSGGCLCGEVQFELKSEFKAFYQCHCKQCQKLTGSAFASNLFTSIENINWIKGIDSISHFDDTEREFSKSFCQNCGSALPFINKRNTSLIVPAGSLDSKIGTQLQANIFVAEKASWSKDSCNAKNFDGFPS